MKPTSKTFEFGARVRPFLGERGSGDATVIIEEPHGLFVAIVDVLGHGQEAHGVAVLIEQWLRDADRQDLCSLLLGLHEKLKGTRGCAIGVGQFETESCRLRYAGIGNTVARRVGEPSTRLVSRDGTLGHLMRTPREETLHLKPSDVMLFYTDGITDHFSLNDYPALLTDPARTVAHRIVNRFGKEHDDAACIVVRCPV